MRAPVEAQAEVQQGRRHHAEGAQARAHPPARRAARRARRRGVAAEPVAESEQGRGGLRVRLERVRSGLERVRSGLPEPEPGPEP